MEIDRLEFTFLYGCTYTDVPAEPERYETTWVDYPNALFDPERGHELYGKHLRIYRLADQLGFDAVGINEHHGTQMSMAPAISVMASAIVANTSKARVLVSGTPLTLQYPNRLAEEYAMLDVLSGGRMEYGLPLGAASEYWSSASQVNPATARARFRESLQVLMQAWTVPGPTRFDGDFYNYRYLNCWPRPYQQPHPQLFLAGSGSPETIDLALEFGLSYAVVLTPTMAQRQALLSMREQAAERGREMLPSELAMMGMVYTADTDEEAVAEMRPHAEHMFGWNLKAGKFMLPPGYYGIDDYAKRTASFPGGGPPSFDAMLGAMPIVAGSPDTVADTIVEWCREARCGRFNGIFEMGNMPEWKLVKSMTLFAEEVIPRIQQRLAGSGAASDVNVDGRVAAAAPARS